MKKNYFGIFAPVTREVLITDDNLSGFTVTQMHFIWRDERNIVMFKNKKSAESWISDLLNRNLSSADNIMLVGLHSEIDIKPNIMWFFHLQEFIFKFNLDGKFLHKAKIMIINDIMSHGIWEIENQNNR